MTLLNDDFLQVWGNFDLEKEIKKFASKRTGFRFHEDEPSIALLLLQNNVLTSDELLRLRLKKRRQDNRNPFPESYDDKLCQMAEKLPEVDGDKEVAEGRTDLRYLPLVTIDPHDAKDFDDAVCLIRDGEELTLWVAIADVANYVHKSSRLDSTAKSRATSVYLPHTVLPMLPPRLADDLCSLRSGVDRLAMVVSMSIKNKEILLPFKSDFCWPYVYVDDVVSCIDKCLFHEKEHFYDYNVSGPDFPTYHKIVNEVSQHIGNLQVNFLNHNSVSERKLFSLQKIKNDILWEPKYSIERGIKDYIDNIA